MQTSAEQLTYKMMLLYENIYSLLDGFQKATTSGNNNIEVSIKKLDGTVAVLPINSFQLIQNELSRIDANYKSLISAENLSYTIQKDGSISQQTKTSFLNAEYLSNFVIGESCIIDKKSFINDLIYPNVKLPITIDSALLSDVYCKTFEVTSGWENVPVNPKLIDINYLMSIGKIEATEVNRSLKLEKNQIQYFGKFNILSVVSVNANEYTIVVDDIKYTSLYVNGNSIELKVNDLLVSKTGSSKYIINSIDKISKQLVLTRVAGSELLTVGLGNLFFNEMVSDTANIVGVPVKPLQKLVIFLSTENLKNISYPSDGIKIDTSTYEVVYENQRYTLDDYFTLYVTNFSDYLFAYIDETTIPASLGIKPSKPVLNISNFKVVQINKHLTDAKNVNELSELNTRKLNIQNDITYKLQLIDEYKNQLKTQTFKTAEERKNREALISTLTNDINILETNVLNLSKTIDIEASKYGLKNITPKYKLIGFWQLQQPITSSKTGKQNIIKYDVLFRYLSKNSDFIENTTYKMTNENGDLVTVAFSPWNEANTSILNKVADELGNWNWEMRAVDSIEQININQCAISINEGESIEIKIRSVSEAGYPIAPIKSDWSEIIRIDFPSDINTQTISATLSQNNVDLANAQFVNILKQYNLLEHINNQVIDGDNIFSHKAENITSGLYTSEQKNIPLNVALAEFTQRLKALETNKTTNTVDISVIDFNNEIYKITNNSTLELFAGNYVDSANILDSSKWGTIVRKKAYIKIKNNNTLPIEIKSLNPGSTFNELSAPNYFNVPVKNNDLIQKSKQIIYFRNVDLTGQQTELFKLIVPQLPDTNTLPADIDTTADDASKNIVYLDTDDNEIKVCKLMSVYSTAFVGFKNDHPLFNINDLTVFESEFNRIKKYTANLKADQFQDELVDTLGFNDNDFYSVGDTTCGAFFYPLIPNQSAISVIGENTISTLIVPKESEILIPIIFEFRMIDRIGNVNGLVNTDPNVLLQYSKKIGIDLILPDNTLFKFDINCIGKLKSKINLSGQSVNSLLSSFNGETQQPLT